MQRLLTPSGMALSCHPGEVLYRVGVLGAWVQPPGWGSCAQSGPYVLGSGHRIPALRGAWCALRFILPGLTCWLLGHRAQEQCAGCRLGTGLAVCPWPGPPRSLSMCAFQGSEADWLVPFWRGSMRGTESVPPFTLQRWRLLLPSTSPLRPLRPPPFVLVAYRGIAPCFPFFILMWAAFWEGKVINEWNQFAEFYQKSYIFIINSLNPSGT